MDDEIIDVPEPDVEVIDVIDVPPAPVAPVAPMPMPNDIPRKAWQNVEDLLSTLNDNIKMNMGQTRDDMKQLSEDLRQGLVSVTAAVEKLNKLMEAATAEPQNVEPQNVEPKSTPIVPDTKPKYKGYRERRKG